MLAGRALVKLRICFSFQLLDAIPMKPHGIVMDAVVTDSTKSLQDRTADYADSKMKTGTPLFFLESDAADIRSFIDDCIGRRVDPGPGD